MFNLPSVSFPTLSSTIPSNPYSPSTDFLNAQTSPGLETSMNSVGSMPFNPPPYSSTSLPTPVRTPSPVRTPNPMGVQSPGPGMKMNSSPMGAPIVGIQSVNSNKYRSLPSLVAPTSNVNVSSDIEGFNLHPQPSMNTLPGNLLEPAPFPDDMMSPTAVVKNSPMFDANMSMAAASPMVGMQKVMGSPLM